MAKALADTKGKLREAIYRAGIYFESSHEKPSNVERLIALAIALESLFSPDDRGEFTFRISQSAAQFVGQTVEERQAICREVKRMYGKRSELFHGSYDVDKYNRGEFVTHDEVDGWSSLIRRALLGFFILYFKGATDRNEVLRRIEAAAFDGAAAEQLRADSQIDRLFEKE